MVKGFVFFQDGKIPFVIENYRMELFTDDLLLGTFCREHNFKDNFILHGQCFEGGLYVRKATFLVDHSMGSTCYLKCYILNMSTENELFDSIGLQSPFLDNVFGYSHIYFEKIRSGINLAMEPQDIYKIPFCMNDLQYELTFRMGYDNRLGLLEDLDRKGEFILPLYTGSIQECYTITTVLYRLAMFMASKTDVPFKCITLYKKGLKAGWFFCPFLSENNQPLYGGFFHGFDVMRYIPMILNNIALNPGTQITKSIPLGHLGNQSSMYSPQRFMEQVMAFEYLFDKLDHKNANNSHFPLKSELECMFNSFPHLLSNTKLSADKISDQIKSFRNDIAHGHSYFYDFQTNHRIQYIMHLLDQLIQCMSLKWIGFSSEDIKDYKII